MRFAFDHVQLAIPRGSEAACRAFYVGLLGLTEVPKPPVLAARGGMWLRADAIELHLGIEEDFRPARKAHPALRVDELDILVARLEAGGVTVAWDEAVPGRRRCFTEDPVGNRIELIGA